MELANNTVDNQANIPAGNQVQPAEFKFMVVTPEMMAADGGVVRRRIACVACSKRRRRCVRANVKDACAYCTLKNFECKNRV